MNYATGKVTTPTVCATDKDGNQYRKRERLFLPPGMPKSGWRVFGEFKYFDCYGSEPEDRTQVLEIWHHERVLVHDASKTVIKYLFDEQGRAMAATVSFLIGIEDGKFYRFGLNMDDESTYSKSVLKAKGYPEVVWSGAPDDVPQLQTPEV